MLNTIIANLLPKRGTPPAPLLDEAELLTDLEIPDPVLLQRRLQAAEQQRDADDRRYAQAQLEQQHDPQAWSDCAAIAARRPAVTAEIKKLRAEKDAAEIGRRAFLDLARIESEVRADIDTRTAAVYERLLTSPPAERRAMLSGLHAQIRLHARIIGALGTVSRARRFRRPKADPLAALRSDLLDRVTELERMHMPGVERPAIIWPERAQELMSVIAKKGTPA